MALACVGEAPVRGKWSFRQVQPLLGAKAPLRATKNPASAGTEVVGVGDSPMEQGSRPAGRNPRARTSSLSHDGSGDSS